MRSNEMILDNESPKFVLFSLLNKSSWCRCLRVLMNLQTWLAVMKGSKLNVGLISWVSVIIIIFLTQICRDGVSDNVTYNFQTENEDP